MTSDDDPPRGDRLQKLLASWGLSSRRGIEDWLRAGRIRINGRVAALGDRAVAGDLIEVDGQPVGPPAGATVSAREPAVLLYHKPVGEVTTRSDPQGRPTVFERLPVAPAGRWVVVGRLDVNTSGLLLFTDDGALAHRLMHPSFEVTRRYVVRVRGAPSPATLARLRAGVELDDGPAGFDRLEPLHHDEGAGSSWFEVALHEGRNREVRRIWESVGHEVSRLKRVAYGPFELPDDLPAAQVRWLDAATARSLIAALQVPE